MLKKLLALTAFVVLTLCSTLLIFFSIRCPAGEVKIIPPLEQPDVSIDTAKKVASNELPRTVKLLKEFNNATISSKPPIIFSDLNGIPVAYVFEVNRNEKYAGYITVSASQKLYPIIEYTTAPLPTANLESCQKVAQGILKADPEKVELLYLGGPDYLARFFSTKGQYVIVSLASGRVISEEEALVRSDLLNKKIEQIKLKAQERWKKYISP